VKGRGYQQGRHRTVAFPLSMIVGRNRRDTTRVEDLCIPPAIQVRYAKSPRPVLASQART